MHCFSKSELLLQGSFLARICSTIESEQFNCCTIMALRIIMHAARPGTTRLARHATMSCAACRMQPAASHAAVPRRPCRACAPPVRRLAEVLVRSRPLPLPPSAHCWPSRGPVAERDRRPPTQVHGTNNPAQATEKLHLRGVFVFCLFFARAPAAQLPRELTDTRVLQTTDQSRGASGSEGSAHLSGELAHDSHQCERRSTSCRRHACTQ